jgi:hypothetical protein
MNIKDFLLKTLLLALGLYTEQAQEEESCVADRPGAY